MRFTKPDQENQLYKKEFNLPNYVRYLIGLAILIFALIIGYNAFVAPDVDTSVQISADNMVTREENDSLGAAKININKAAKDELMKLKGIGEQTAEKIINYRETHGGFSSKEELMEVSGIGEKTFEKLKDEITI
jgi:comEA protein